MKYKRLLSFILSVLMALNMVVYLPWKSIVFAEESAFDVIQYKAQLYVTEGEIPYGSIMYYCDEFVSPATDLANQMNSNVAFLASVAAWETATFESKDVSQGYVDEVGYYEAMIFHMLNQYESSEFIETAFENEYIANSKDFFSIYENSLKMKLGTDVLGFLDNYPDTAESKKMILDSFDEAFEEVYPDISDKSEFLDTFDKIIKLGEIGEHGINNFIAYMTCYNLTEGMKNVVYDLNQSCDTFSNPALKTAFANIATACHSYELAWAPALFDVGINGFQFVFGEVTDGMFNSILAAEPLGLGVMLGRAITQPIVNMAFSTDTICEQYHKMKCLKELETLIKNVAKQEIQDYRETPSNENAETMFSSVEIMFNLLIDSCNMAEAYAEIVFTNGVAGIFSENQKKYEDFKAKTTELKEIIQDTYDNHIANYWYEIMQCDYPETWEKIFATPIPVQSIAVSGISLEQHEVTINLAEYKKWGMFSKNTFMQMTIIPNNTTNRNVSFSSSDTDIVTIASSSCYPNLYLIPISVGTATVTVTTEDGGYTDSIKIAVVNNEENFTNTPSTPEIESNGFKYEELSNDTVKITGYVGKDTEIVIPKKINGKIVTCIGQCAFRNSSLSSVIIPDSVTSIQSNAFSGCTFLTSVTLPDSVVSIGEDAFNSCTNLTEIVIPNNVNSIETRAFYNCTNLTKVTILNPNCKIDCSTATICNRFDDIRKWYFYGTIYGYENSTAQTYADKVRLPRGLFEVHYGVKYSLEVYKFESLGKAPVYEKGNILKNGSISVADAVCLQKYLHGKQKFTKEQAQLADMNDDSIVNIYDLLLLKRKLIYG